MDAQAFTDRAVKALRAARMEAEVLGPLLLRVGSPDGPQAIARLDNLLAEVRRSPEALTGVLERCVGSARDALCPSDGRPGSILPLLRHEEQVRRAWALRPGAPRMPATHFLGPIWICYGFDGQDSLRLVSREAVDQLALDDESLARTALDNLRRRLLPELVGDGPVWQVASGGTYDGAWLLDPTLWERLSEQIPGTLVAAVPARDVLLVSSLSIPGGRGALADLVQRVMGDVDHALWDGLLVRIDGRWTTTMP